MIYIKSIIKFIIVHFFQFMATLDTQFDGKVLALSSDRGNLRGREWSPYSPDLNPLDFFAWGFLKSKVYRPRPLSLNNLKQKIETEVNNLSFNVISRAQFSVAKRAALYFQKNGAYF